MNDTPFDWKALLLYLRERMVVPVIGPEAVTVVHAGRTMPFDRYVAEQLAASLAIDVSSLPAAYSLSDINSTFLRQHRGDRRRLWIEILSIVERAPFPPSDALLTLAAIDELSLFVTTTFDPLLARALAQTRGDAFRDANVCAYSLRSQVADLDDDWTPKTPIVYHLFGRAAASGDYVVSDEDRLEFIHALQSDARQPRLLFDHLRDSHLLLIGCSFPDWLTRFFLRTLRRERLGTDRDRYEAVADDRTHVDAPLVMFLNDCHVQVYEGGTAAFVRELGAQLERPGRAVDAAAAPAPTAPHPGSPIFLSYASEDRERVARIRDALEAGGVPVWFDQRSLEPGDEFKAVIREAIEKCTFFFPCLSVNSLTPQLRRFFRFEWNRAIEEADFRQQDLPFIQPLLLDEIAPDSDKIPPAFRSRHVQRCIDGHLPPEFVKLTVERLASTGGAVRRR